MHLYQKGKNEVTASDERHFPSLKLCSVGHVHCQMSLCIQGISSGGTKCCYSEIQDPSSDKYVAFKSWRGCTLRILANIGQKYRLLSIANKCIAHFSQCFLKG